MEAAKPKVCLTVGTQTDDVEQKTKSENITTQTSWETESISTQTVSLDAKNIETQTLNPSTSIGLQTTIKKQLKSIALQTLIENASKSIGLQTTIESKCLTNAIECQTDEWIPEILISDYPEDDLKAVSITSTDVHQDAPDEDQDDEYDEIPMDQESNILDEDETIITDEEIHLEIVKEEVLEEREPSPIEEHFVEDLQEDVEYLMEDEDYELTIVDESIQSTSNLLKMAKSRSNTKRYVIFFLYFSYKNKLYFNSHFVILFFKQNKLR